MKHTKERMCRLLVLLLLFASRASAANKGFVIAMRGGNGTLEIYEKWKTLSGGTICLALNKAGSPYPTHAADCEHVLLGAAETVASHTCPTHWWEVKLCDFYFEQPSGSGLKRQPLFLYFRDIC